MIKKKNKKILIACYRNPYNKQSIEKIKNIIKKEKPGEVIILSISETKKSSGTIESYLGRKDVEKLRGQFEKDQRLRSSGYSDKIIELSEKLEIPAKKIEKKGKASDIILKAVEEYKPSKVIIHPSDKSNVDKIISDSVEDTICKESKCDIKSFK
jgi:hypothetical protein